jgi:hypothetical protein
MENENFELGRLTEMEKQMSELLDTTCELLYPTTGFELELQGLKPTILTQKELEAYGKVNLDTVTGATIKMTYDISLDQLVLKSIRHPLKDQPSSALVIHETESDIDGLTYIAFLDFDNQIYTPSQSEKNGLLRHDALAAILKGYGIDDAPHPSHDDYRLWRANLLSNCQQGWKVAEQVELLVYMEDNKTDTVKVSVHEEYNQDGTVNRVKQISKSTTETDSSIRKSESKLMQVDTYFDRELSLVEEMIETEYDPFIKGNPGPVLAHETEASPINQASFKTFKSLLDETAEYLVSSNGN